MPIPGWTLPGVMTVGAAQIALKTGGLVPGRRHLDRRSGTVDHALCRTGDPGRADGSPAFWTCRRDRPDVRAVRHLPAAIADMRKGIGWLREIRRAGVSIHARE